MSDLEIYKDTDLSGEPIESINMGEIEAGKEKEETFWISNTTQASIEDLEIIPSTDDIDLEYSTKLDENGKIPLKISWNTDKDLEKALESELEFKYKMIFRR